MSENGDPGVEELPAEASGWAVSGIWVGVLSVVGLVLAAFTGSAVLFGIAVALLVLGSAWAGVASFRTARSNGLGAWRVFGRSFRAAFGFFFWFSF